jgi:FlaA1/EpsC-like NDP-sugar epimerase
MSLSEATQLLLQAGLQGKGGKSWSSTWGAGAHRRSGARPDQAVRGRSGQDRVVFTGLRPREKLYEELLATEEATKPTPHPQAAHRAGAQVNRDLVGQMVTWCESDRAADDAEVRARLKAWMRNTCRPRAPVMPIPTEAPAGREDTRPLPLRVPRKR